MAGIVVRGRDGYEGEDERERAVRRHLAEIEVPFKRVPYESRPQVLVQGNGVLGVRVAGPDEVIGELSERPEAEGFPVVPMSQFDAEMKDRRRDTYGRLQQSSKEV